MEWTFVNGDLDNVDLTQYVGFVYLITNKIDGRKYIGKKLTTFSKTTTRKNKKTGKVKKIRSKVESDWRSYYGSNKELNDDVKRLGEENFERLILEFCETKGKLSYRELVYQIENRVLEKKEYYNSIIQVRIHKSHVYNK